MKLIAVLSIALLPSIIFGQACDCKSNFEWVKKTFEENDAGYSLSLAGKGEAAYTAHNSQFAERVKTVTDRPECFKILHEWLRFFRSGHIAINPLNQPEIRPAPTDEKAIIEKYKDWEKMDVNLAAFNTYLSAKNSVDVEGVWTSGVYEIGIKKTGAEYVGFIIKADGVYWKEGQIKLRINSNNSATFYMRDHAAQHFDSFQLIGKNTLEIGFTTLKRKFPEYETEKNIELHYKAINAQSPFFERINETTTLLRIPSFEGSAQTEIDNLIESHKAEILKTPNLIIDVRNNGGGNDRCYYPLLPFIYTDTIRTVGVEFLSTPLNNQRMKKFATSTEYGFEEHEKKEFQAYYDKLSNSIGEFVNLELSAVKKTSFDTIYPYPKNVGIIINGGDGSTTEQFLLAAKQSKKVKLFGTKTFGSLDFSNMNFVQSPCGEFELGYCLSKSYRVPDMAIDEVGIQPDYYIDKTVPKYSWIDFVVKILNKS